MGIGLNVHEECFNELMRKEMYYVDKTEILYDLFSEDFAKVIEFTRPRCFGKTLMLTMMENFFDINKDSREMFSGLDIMDHPEFCEMYMNEYPVLYVSFKSVYGKDFEEAYIELEKVITKLATRVLELADDKKIKPAERAIFKYLKSKKKYGKDDFVKATKALKAFTKVLSVTYNTKVILLIDDYDVPLVRAYEKDKNVYYNRMLGVMRGVLGFALSGNPYLEFGVMTGCIHIPKDQLLHGVKDFESHSILDERFSSYFGFTELEVQDILASVEREDRLQEVQDWYDGYNFGLDHMYCPYDVINYVVSLEYDDYEKLCNNWRDNIENDVLYFFIDSASEKIKRDIEKIVSGGFVAKPISKDLNCALISNNEDSMWEMLLLAGYITKEDIVSDAGSVELAIPNREMLNVFKDTIVAHFRESVQCSERDKLMEALWSGDDDTVTELITKFLAKSINYSNYNEGYYHAFIIGLFTGLDYIVDFNKEDELGRPDILVRDHNNRRAMVIEVKEARVWTAIEKTCDFTIDQIRERQYNNRKELDGFEIVLCYAIVCHEKSVVTRCMIDKRTIQ